MPLLGRGIRPVAPRFQQWDGFQAENFNFNNMAQGRSRSFPTPQPFLQIYYRSQPIAYHAAGQWIWPCGSPCPVPKIEHHHSMPPTHLNMNHPPPPPQDQESETESSSSESSDSEEGNFLKAP